MNKIGLLYFPIDRLINQVKNPGCACTHTTSILMMFLLINQQMGRDKFSLLFIKT